MKKHNNQYLFLVLLLFLAIAAYFIIYLCFGGDYGFSPGNGLNKSDWLSFFGSYLGFASSTLLAIAVFKQDQKINALVSKEYDPIVIFRVVEFERVHNHETNSRYVVINSDKRKLFFEQFIFDPKHSSDNSDMCKSPFRIYLSVESKGKLPLRDLTITEIKLDDSLCAYEKDIDNKQLVVNEIQPNGIRNICLKFNEFPHVQDSDVHTLHINYSVHISDSFVYTSQCLLRITGDESTIIDGIECHTK